MVFPEDNKLKQTQNQMHKYSNGHQVWLSKASALWNARTTSVTRCVLVTVREGEKRLLWSILTMLFPLTKTLLGNLDVALPCLQSVRVSI